MPLFQYNGDAFTWADVEPFVAPAFEGFETAVRSDFLRSAEQLGAPDALIDLLDSLNEGRQYKGINELRQDLVSMGHVSEA